MFAYLRGHAQRLTPQKICIDVHGVGYLVHCPMTVWEEIRTDDEVILYTSTYVREDRFDIFGFLTEHDKEFFELCIAQSGIGPKMALELVAVPKHLYITAVTRSDATVLTSIKGIGAKTAEKLLLELRSIIEKNSHIFSKDASQNTAHYNDQDAMMALMSLGYDQKTALAMLASTPNEALTTEERIALALQSLS